MTRQEFIQNIVDEITISGSLKVTVKTEEIERIIDNEKRNVFRNWRDTVELRYGIIPLTQFRTPEFRQSRTIQFPDCVWGIEEFREIRDGSRLFGINDPDLSMERVMGSDLWLSPFSSDVITTRTVSYSWFDLARSFTLKDINFNFNLNTKRVHIIGHDPIAPVICRVYTQIEDSALYDDYYLGRNYENRFKSEKEAFETGYYDSFVYINHGEPSEEEKEIIDRLLDYEISLYFKGE